MKGIIASLIVSIFAISAYAEPPSGVGSAEGSEGPCFSQTIVGPPGNFFPILDGVHGVLFTQLGDAKFVDANSAGGTANLTCHGKVEPGEEIAGTDVATGQPATGTAASTPNACSALEAFGFTGACRGNGKGAIIINAEFQGSTCGWDGLETLDWTEVRTPNGQSMISCHFKD